MQREEHFTQRTERMRLHPSERTQPDRGETNLKLANVNLPDGQVVKEIPGAVPICGVNPLQRLAVIILENQRPFVQFLHLRNQPLGLGGYLMLS
jgi:hypothetical protein